MTHDNQPVDLDRREALKQPGRATASDKLKLANDDFARRFPGDRGDRKPVHTVYGGAHLFKAATPRKLGDLALRALDEYAVNFAVFGRALKLPGHEDLPQCSRDLDHLLSEGSLVRSNAVRLEI